MEYDKYGSMEYLLVPCTGIEFVLGWPCSTLTPEVQYCCVIHSTAQLHLTLYDY